MSYNKQIKKLFNFYKTNGHLFLEIYLNKKYDPLITWCELIRKDNGILNGYQIKQLNIIGFIWNNSDYIWELMLKRFILSKISSDSIDQKLKNWIKNNRDRYKKLPKTKQVKLIEAGFKINIRESRWDEKYKELTEYFIKYGHSNVIFRQKNYESLSFWVYKQRLKYNNLSREKKLKLKKVKFKIDTSNFEDMVKQMKEFKKEYGHIKVTSKFRQNEKYKTLAFWYSNMLYRDIKTCTNKQLKTLKKIGMIS